MKLSRSLMASVLAIALGAASAGVYAKSQSVHFARGATAASYAGQVKGYHYDSYVFHARKGQQLTVSITGSANANAYLYGHDDFVQGQAYALPKTGQYTVRVAQPRAMARRGQSSHYRIKISIQ